MAFFKRHRERWIKIAIILLARCPFRLAQYLGKSVGYILSRSNSSIKQMALSNIRHCFPELSASKQKKMAHQSVIHGACAFTEFPAFWLWPNDCLAPLINSVVGEEILQAGVAQQQGVIVAVPHLGAWEGSQAYFAGRHPVTAMYRPSRFTSLNNFIMQARSRYQGAHFVPTDRSGVKQLLLALKEGKLIFILPDQVPHNNEGRIAAPFFGQPAQTMKLIAKLLQKTHAKLVFLTMKRLHCGRGFDIVLSAPLNPFIAQTP